MDSKTIQKYSKYSVPELLKKCQTVFNKYIRERDKDLPCVSCGTGKPSHAGHFMSQGHHSALRFNEFNTGGQCIRCNVFLHGNLLGYRKGLIKRYGEDKVVELENTPKTAHKWNRFELIEKIETYKLKSK